MHGKFFYLSVLLGSFIAIGASTDVKIEHGFRFGDIKDNNDSSLEQATEKELLAELVKLNRKQLKEQTRIREILENEYDPKPKVITMPDGTKCVENSTEKCFSMPMIPEVRRIPAIANAYRNPTLENIKTREKWYAKYTNRVLNDVYLKSLAIREMGSEYNLATKPIGTINTTGMDSVLLKKYKKEVVEKFVKDFEYNIFLGKNTSLDMYALVRLSYLVRNNPKMKFNLIFNSENSKKHWEKQYSNFYSSKYLKKLPVFVQPKAFKEFKVETTPSIYLKDKKKNKDTILIVGRVTDGDIIQRTIEYLIANKYIKRSDLSMREAWNSKSSEDTVKYYYNQKLGIKYEK